jgi:hypothetical protein
MSARVAGAYLGEMVEGFSARMGRTKAVEEVARRVRLSLWPVEKLVGGKVKTITTDKFVKIRAAYLTWCLEDLKAEIARKEQRFAEAQAHDLLESLADEILELRARVRQMEKVQT